MHTCTHAHAHTQVHAHTHTHTNPFVIISTYIMYMHAILHIYKLDHAVHGAI